MSDRPPASSVAVSHRMAKHPRRDTGPEMALRRALHASGERYRVCMKIASAPRRTIDIAFTRVKVAIFIDGCFWHGCPEHGEIPKSNRRWWEDKIARNRLRDQETTQLLTDHGWAVLRFWEHHSVDDAVARIKTEVHRRRTFA